MKGTSLGRLALGVWRLAFGIGVRPFGFILHPSAFILPPSAFILQQLSEWFLLHPRLQVPPGAFGTGLRKRIPFEEAERAEQLLRRLPFPADEERAEDL